MQRAAWIGILIFSVAGLLAANQVLFTSFEGFKVGASIDKQNGWSAANPSWDQQITSSGGNTVWRVSNAVTSGGFGDMPFAPRLGGIPADSVTNPTNNSPGAFAGESSTGTSLREFFAGFSFLSTTVIPQPGLRITVSADEGDGARQSFIALEDTGDPIRKIEVSTLDVDINGNMGSPVVIASGLSYTDWHTISWHIHFEDGPNNDQVYYFVDYRQVHIGPSWEQFYRNFQAASHPLGVPVQTLIFRLSDAPCGPPSCLGRGYLIDNVSLLTY